MGGFAVVFGGAKGEISRKFATAILQLLVFLAQGEIQVPNLFPYRRAKSSMS
jgi:hypothetical protein